MINFSTFPPAVLSSMRFQAVYVSAPQTAHMTGTAASVASTKHINTHPLLQGRDWTYLVAQPAQPFA